MRLAYQCRWATLLACLLIVSSADAAGLWNLPTNLRQCVGVGFGPGYHAPMHLGSPFATRSASQHVYRTWRPPKPMPGGYGFSGSMATLDVQPMPAYQSPVHAPAIVAPTPTLAQPQMAPVTRVPGRPVEQIEPPSPSDAPQPETLPLPPQ